jgi:hypothetical protein
MTAIIIIGIILFIIYAASSKKKPPQQNTTYTNPDNKQKSEKEIRDELEQSLIKKIKVTVTTSSSAINYNDDSIIDVTGNYENILTENNLLEFENWKLGNRYKDELKLNKNEIEILNGLIDTDNKFNSIRFCAENLIRLLFECLNYLDNYYGIEEHKKIKTEIIDIEARNHFNYRQGSLNYNNALIELSNKYNQCIYKICENELRENLNVGRKTDLTWYIHSKVSLDLFESKVLSIIRLFIKEDLAKISDIDLDSEIKINNYNRSRYKNILENIKSNFKTTEIHLFNDKIIDLEKRNLENPFIENIYFEASKFISKYENKLALEFYIKYLHHDLKSVTFDNKQLTKTIQKNLFKTNEQLHDFEIIVSELIKDKDLEKALKNVSKIYELKRKKIQLDTTSIKEVQQQHSETVELLNEYLKDDFEDENNSIKSQEINNEEIKIQITRKSEATSHSAFVSDLIFSPIHISALELFSKSNFSIPQSEIEIFAKSKGIFKNQLIESINETCYDFLDDLLIEEEDDYYTININYFQRISVK